MSNKNLKFNFFFVCLFLCARIAGAAGPVYEAVSIPEKKLFVGEKLVYQIEYLGVPVGEGRAEVAEKTVYLGRPAYHITVTVRSYKAIDWIYKVRDEHHSYIDAENFQSLALQKKIREGRRRHEESVDMMKEHPGMQDEISCGYFFRTLKIEPRTSVFIPVHADGKDWNLEVKLLDTKPLQIKGAGSFQAIEAQPLMAFQGFFLRKGKVDGWISLDKRRIPLKMSVKIPVLGPITAELKEYVPGHDA